MNLAFYQSVTASLLLGLLVICSSSARKQDEHQPSSAQDPPGEPESYLEGNLTYQNHFNFHQDIPEIQFWYCIINNGLNGTSNITHDMDFLKIAELLENITAMQTKFEAISGMWNETNIFDQAGPMPDMYNFSGAWMENCTSNATSGWPFCSGFNSSMMNFTPPFFSNGSVLWTDFNSTIDNLTDMMMSMDAIIAEFLNFTMLKTWEFLEGQSSVHGYHEQMFIEDTWKLCLEKVPSLLSVFGVDDHMEYSFTESLPYQTLKRLGIISIMTSHGMDPSQYFSHSETPIEDLGADQRPFIRFRIVRFIEAKKIMNVTWKEMLDLLQAVEFDRDSYSYLMSHMEKGNFEMLLLAGRELVKNEGLPPPSVIGGMLAAAEVHWGPVPRWTASHVDKLWLYVIGIGKERLLRFSTEAFKAALPNLAVLYRQHRLDPFLATAAVDAAMEHWGNDLSKWTIAKLQELGPFFVYLSLQSLNSLDVDDLLVLLPDINTFDFDKRQGQAIISKLASSPEWTWSLEQFESLGKLAAFLTVDQLQSLPEEVFSSREAQKYMLSNSAGRKREMKEVAKRIVSEMGDPSTWSGQDLAKIGQVAAGLEVKDLERIPKSSIVSAVSDLSQADLSRRQKMVIAQKFQAASSSNSTNKKLTSRDIHQLRSLSVGLGSEVFAKMSPEDVKESIDVLAENAKEMQPTQKREIFRQMKKASGGIAGSLKDLGSMVQEVPLKDLNDMRLEDIGTDVVKEDNSTEAVLTLGTIQWNKGQSTKLYRKIKEELLTSENGTNGGFTSDTISMLGTVMVGMMCEDIALLETNDIFRLADVMMKQTGWNLRQTRCISNRVRDFFSHGHDFMANFTLAEVNSLTGQILKEFTPEELSHLSGDVCDVSFANIGLQKELEEMRRSKRQEVAQMALKCLGKTSSDTVISGEDMETLGYLSCELEPDDIDRVDVADLRTHTLDVAGKCCYDRFQMVAVGRKVVEQLGSTETWTSTVMESVAPFLLYLSPHQIEVLDENELSVIAEGIMDMYADFGEKLPLCERDLSEEDLEERQRGFVRVAVKVKETMVAMASDGNTRRKKRDTTYTPSCDQIELLEDGNIAWSLEELAAMTNETFDSCAYMLGGITGLTTDQLDVLLDKAIQVWGEPSQMTPDELSQLGIIATRFTPLEMGDLNLTNIDTVYSLAQYGNWSMEQMSAAVSQYLQMSEKGLEELNSVDIAGLDQFICGLTANEITQLNSSSYGVSTGSISTLEICTTDQLGAFKGHAVMTFGPIASWQPEIFAEVGVVVAGFTADELSMLSTESIAGITPLAISLIQPDTFGDGFTLDILGAFDEAQALAVTEEQLAALSSNQSLALKEAEYGEEEIPPEIIDDLQNPESTTSSVQDPTKEPGGGPESTTENEQEKEPKDEPRPDGTTKIYQGPTLILILMAVCYLI